MNQIVARALLALALVSTAIELSMAAETLSKDIAARIEAIPIQTLTISDEQFLNGDGYGRPTTIAGVLRVAQGSGQLPLVVLVPGSGGINAGIDLWDRQFEPMGISTFALDSFAGRGIVSTVVDQSQLGRLNGIIDLYRALAILAAHPPSRSGPLDNPRRGGPGAKRPNSCHSPPLSQLEEPRSPASPAAARAPQAATPQRRRREA